MYFARACVCNHYTVTTLQMHLGAVHKGTESCTTHQLRSVTSHHVHIDLSGSTTGARVPVENPQELKAGERAYPLAKAMPASAVAGFAGSPSCPRSPHHALVDEQPPHWGQTSIAKSLSTASMVQ